MTVQRQPAAMVDILSNHFLEKNALYADPKGYLTAPNMPRFSAYLSPASIPNVTGDGTLYTIICDTEIEDRGGNYDHSTGIFTAPVTGFDLCVNDL